MSGFDQPTANSPTVSSSQTVEPSSQNFTIRFWGVRGSIPTPGIETLRYGGNTACVEIQVGGERLIFDGGTGLRILGKKLYHEMPVRAHLFFTHTHWDRIQGFPFFIPAFIKGNNFDIYGAMGPNGASIKQRLCDQMLRPNFPVPLRVMQSEMKFHDITPGSVITLGDVTIETISLNRPNGALGYRITWGGRSVVYATDTEHSSDRLDQSLLYLAHQADVLIYDAAYADPAYYTPELAPEESAPWHTGTDVAIAAEVKKVFMFHHDPAHEDDFLDQVEVEVQSRLPNVLLAREGMEIDVLADKITTSRKLIASS